MLERLLQASPSLDGVSAAVKASACALPPPRISRRFGPILKMRPTTSPMTWKGSSKRGAPMKRSSSRASSRSSARPSSEPSEAPSSSASKSKPRTDSRRNSSRKLKLDSIRTINCVYSTILTCYDKQHSLPPRRSGSRRSESQWCMLSERVSGVRENKLAAVRVSQ
jgi:hypothetical protein